jgi:hypothetical protein
MVAGDSHKANRMPADEKLLQVTELIKNIVK